MKKLKRFFAYYKPHKRLFGIDLVCSFLISVANMFYPMIARDIMQAVEYKDLQFIITWGIVLFAIYVTKALLTFIVGYWGHVLGVRIQADMRRDLFGHIERLPFSFFDENKTGSVLSRLTNDLFEVSELAHHGPEDLFNSCLSIVGALVMLTFINGWLALAVLLYIPLMVAFASFARTKMSKAFTNSRKRVSELNAEIESSLTGVRVTKAYNAARTECEKFAVVNGNFKTARSEAYKAMGLFQGGMSLFNDLLYLLALVFGGLMFYFGQIAVEDFTAYILFITQLLSPIRTIVILFEQIQDGATGFNRFCEIMDTAGEYEPSEPKTAEMEGDIVFDNVTFSYKQGENTEVLKGISFTARQGKTLALVGSSGGGKTTICHLIPRFYRPDGGKITIGGTDVEEVLAETLRAKIALVAQDVFLFAGTVKENIRYGTPNATDEEIVQAAKRANIHEFVAGLEKGYDTEVGERGVKLSGGQKQRISIARAFLKNPSILILDEATSALDNMTEMQVQAALSELSKGRTTVVVAHRLSTVKNADEILVVENGLITERGTHDALVAQGGLYAELYRYQFREN